MTSCQIGDVRTQSMKSIWNSDAMNALRLEPPGGTSHRFAEVATE
jgi:hypothetical protein